MVEAQAAKGRHDFKQLLVGPVTVWSCMALGGAHRRGYNGTLGV